MRRRRHQWGPSVLLASFLFSAVVHLLLGVPFRDFVNDYLSSARPAADKPLKVVRLSTEQWEKNRGAFANRRMPQVETIEDKKLAEAEKKKAEEEKKKKEKEDKLRGQIVEVAPTADDSPNAEAKYLSKYNTHVEKETTARPEDRDPNLKRVTNKLQTNEVQGNPENAQVQTPGLVVKGDGAEETPGKEGEGESDGAKRFALEVPDLQQKEGVELKLSDLPGQSHRLANRDSSESLKGNSDRLHLEMGDGVDLGGGEGGKKKGAEDGAEKKVPNLAALVPTIGTVARISGSPSRDHVDGVPEGDGTFLNTKEFKYATFFYRVRDSVAGYWEDLAAAEYRRRDPTGNIYGIRDRSTLLHIQLTRDGRLDQVRVEQTSGVDFLDNVAVQAFKMAEPFPNPPPGIVEEDGSIRFNFQFVVTMRSRGPFNLFR
jgi:TonB family protein